MRKRNGGAPLLPSRTLTPPKSRTNSISNTTWLLVVTVFSCSSFYAGVWSAWSVASRDDDRVTDLCVKAANGEDGGELSRRVSDIFKTRLDRALHDKKCPEAKCPEHAPARETTSCPEVKCPENVPAIETKLDSTKPRFTSSLDHFLNGAVSISRKNLFDAFDFGVPMSENAENENTLLLYDSIQALPSDEIMKKAAHNNEDIPEMNAVEATANCDTMNVLFVKNPNKSTRQCVALVGGQYQGYHIQRWMRLGGDKLDPSEPLRQVSRMVTSLGVNELPLAQNWHIDMHREIMLTYLTHLKEMQNELKSTLQRIAVNNAVVVMTVNKGQSELLMNFVCSARSRGLDLKNVLLFPTDQFSKDIADSLDLATFYHEELMKGIPSEEAPMYGDNTFAHIMIAKVICVQMINELNYDLLFQDVDVFWYKNPLDYFNLPGTKNFDVYFQDDGSRNEYFAPYSANSGFYFVRSNDRSKFLFRSMLHLGDLIFSCRSHQQVLTTLISETNSLVGLTVKVLSRDEDTFPSGFHYHTRKDWMHQMIDGKKDPYVFHMCWTDNKVNKLAFMKQMGMWFTRDNCVGKNTTEILTGANGLFDVCCSAEPLKKCYYSDKPSVIPCKDSPVLDKGASSFW